MHITPLSISLTIPIKSQKIINQKVSSIICLSERKNLFKKNPLKLPNNPWEKLFHFTAWIQMKNFKVNADNGHWRKGINVRKNERKESLWNKSKKAFLYEMMVQILLFPNAFIHWNSFMMIDFEWLWGFSKWNEEVHNWKELQRIFLQTFQTSLEWKSRKFDWKSF